MLHLSQNVVLSAVTDFYLKSRDFNGITTGQLLEQLNTSREDLVSTLRKLIKKSLCGILYSDVDLNVHILRLGFQSNEDQISRLDSEVFLSACVYPRPKHLKRVVEQLRFTMEPYKLCLALGEPQLAYRSFELRVLENYRNDPRYRYTNNDVTGQICIKDSFYQSDQMLEHDKVFLQTFGFSFDAELNRTVAVCLRYLADLSPLHQLIWKANEVTGDFKLHPDYYKKIIMGDFGASGVSVFEAFLMELHVINQMVLAMERPQLFREDYGGHSTNKPANFTFLVRPTSQEFHSFVLLLDKLLSDNINKDFFMKEIPYETETKRTDGKIVVQQKGTIQILNDWVRENFSAEDWAPWERCIDTFKRVRRLRQKPAHTLDDNVFDQDYLAQQRNLISEAYVAVRILRSLFANAPAGKDASIKIPRWLEESQIWTC